MSLESKRTRMKSGFLFICTVIRSLFHNHSSFRKKAELSSQPLSPTPLVRTGIATLPFPVKPGDLVWCLMPLSEKELKTVPEGHRIRPYWIAQVKNNHIMGFYCSSKPIKQCAENSIFVIPGEVTGLCRSYVDLRQLHPIPFDYLLESICFIPEPIQNQANKWMFLQHRKDSKRQDQIFPVPLMPYPGDILKNKGVVLRCDEQFYTAIKMVANQNLTGGIKTRNQYLSLIHQPIHSYFTASFKADELVGLADSSTVFRLEKNHSKQKKQAKDKEKMYQMQPSRFRCGEILKDLYDQEYVFLFAANSHHYGYPLDDFIPIQLTCLSKKLSSSFMHLPLEDLMTDLQSLSEHLEKTPFIAILKHLQKKLYSQPEPCRCLLHG